MMRGRTALLALLLVMALSPRARAQAPRPDELELLKEVSALVDEFERQTRAYRAGVQAIVERQYLERRQMLQEAFEARVRALEEIERARRNHAIALFEAFLRRYPDDPSYTPDAMFRLAELYFERSYDHYLAESREFDEAIGKYDRGEITEEPVQPMPRFADSIALYQRLITDFPDYRLIDGAHYLLGYCLGEQGEQEAAIATFLVLAEKFPDSAFFVEVWMRIGEFYFDADRLEEAADAYGKVVQNGVGTKFYDKGLYKLAWTHYRVDMFEEAITEFMALVDFADAEKEQGNLEAQALRPESIQYIAISFADERWDRGVGYDFEADETGDQMIDFAVGWFEKAGHRPYEQEVISRLGEILFDSAKYPGAVKALRYALGRDPLAPGAPQLHQKIIEAWERARDFDQAAAARDELFATYVEGSPWWEANRDNGEARRAAEDLTKTSMYTSAIFHHQQAQKYWADQRLDLAKQEFELAANGYKQYLDRFPHDKDAYELLYYLADSYFYSLDFMRAAEAFAQVRDSKAGSKYKIDAALNVIFAHEEEIKRLEKAGKLEPRKVLSGADQPDAPPEPEEIPTVRKGLIESCDAFVEVAPAHERVPAVMYKAAETLYVFHHYPDAKARFETIIERYPEAEVAQFAANLIIDYLLVQKDWIAVERFAQMLQTRRVGDSTEYKKFELGALFNKARQYGDEGEQLLAAGKTREGNAKLEAAAREYVRLVQQNSDHEFADKALFNAAVAYERVRRFESAARLYERVFREYPKSELADKALFLVALKSEQAFDFDKAIDGYLRLVREYPNSPDRANALFNAALALENTQQYARAAREYERYASMFTDREDAPETYYRAAIVHEKRGDEAAMFKTLRQFVRRYRRDTKQAARVIEAHVKMGDYSREKKKQSDAVGYYRDAVKEFRARGLSSSSAAGYHAAKAHFHTIEADLPTYEAMRVSGTGKKQEKALTQKAEKLKAIEDRYREVLNYKQIEWSLAALYRLGYVYENFAETILKAECPREIKRMGQEYCDEYVVMLEDQAAKLEEKIVPAYEKAYQESRNARVVNVWTKRTLEGLNKYRKGDYPLDKEPHGSMIGDLGAGADYAIPDELAAKHRRSGQLEGK